MQQNVHWTGHTNQCTSYRTMPDLQHASHLPANHPGQTGRLLATAFGRHSSLHNELQPTLEVACKEISFPFFFFFFVRFIWLCWANIGLCGHCCAFELMYSFQLFVQISNPDDFKIRIVNSSPISFVLLRCSQGSWASDNPMTPNQLCGRCEFNSAGFLVCPPTIISSLINWDLLYQCFVPFHCALQFLHAICLALACK